MPAGSNNKNKSQNPVTLESPCAENSRTELKAGNAHAKGLRYIIRPGLASGMHEIEPMRQAWELFYTCMGLFIAPRLRAWILHGFCMDSDYMDFEGGMDSAWINQPEACMVPMHGEARVQVNPTVQQPAAPRGTSGGFGIGQAPTLSSETHSKRQPPKNTNHKFRAASQVLQLV